MPDSASRCASTLRLSDGGSSPSSSESFIASALSHMTAIARLAEEAANLDPSLGDLSLAILAKTRQSESSDIRQFRLWPNPRLGDGAPENNSILLPRAHMANGDIEAAETSVLEDRGLESQQNRPAHPIYSQPHAHHPTERHVGRISGTSDLLEGIRQRAVKEANTPDLEGRNGHPNGTTRDESETCRSNDPHSVDPFHVDDTCAAKCLSLLLDASGVTTHPSCYRQKSFSHLQAPIMRKALRSMLQELKKMNPSANISDLKYCSLIPTELHNREIVFSALTLMRTDSGSHVTNDTVQTTLSVKKPDRNRKEVNFAIFSALLQVDPDGICSKKLHEMAVEGIGSSGCSVKPGKRCGGPKCCQESNISPLCEFFDDKNEIVGRGEVYPSISFFQGNQVPPDLVAIRSIAPKPKDAIGSRGENFNEASAARFQLWKVTNVSRYALMDAYGAEVGSAVFATHAVSETGRKKGIQAGDFDIEEAAVLCDVLISDNHASDLYCFSEWYKFGSAIWREVQDPSLTSRAIPKTLADLRSFISVLWHKKHLRKLSMEKAS